ncbi:hypothetical protein G6F33_011893 [Rhizopus arrhizus]|uniref:CCHC-type domain-containing protein n=1 Tax=Rhizopus oryzae TaxID=64495 RepID=A0A9P7BM67_RHIOR|nr:hypothetical protein G6F23_011111 [Rhizopus arrhizus]KAG0905777.1 hypothetical protein G6F33_011893 [Rhizopus arrhizus]KAG0932763.1 hypothetical protein G6F32_011272 [Rhizopus arrhizus]KAG1278750.1 hypothetical protein G6F66_012015 [Rhizopus arrhizus]KAG1301834.1 hypothetical protein G6F64_011450 [Rhizopus arrhizus]
MDEVLSTDPALAYSQLHCDSSQPAYQFPPQPDPNAMEIDAFNVKTPFSRQSRNSRTENKKANQFNQWVRPGVLLCGHCGKEGHLSKRCYQAKRNKNQIQALETTPPTSISTTGSWLSYSTEPIPIVSSSKTTGVNYATIPECQDPILTTTKGATQDAIHSLAYLSQATEYREGPRLSCTINGLSTSCLIDTGATISALRSEVATALNLVIDSSQKLTFTTATGEDASTLGCAAVSVRLGEVSLNLNCHVVDRLAHPLIIGFNDLKTHKAVIDTATGSVKFPGLSSFTSPVAPGSSTASSNFVAPKRYLQKPHSCSVNEALKLPGRHHAYVTIKGPRKTLAMVSTPTNVTLDKLIAVAAGIVQFDHTGLATVKVANLDVKPRITNKGERIAFAEYLPSSFHYINYKDFQPATHSVASISTTTPNNATLDLSGSLGDSLSATETEQMTQLLREFSDCFDSSHRSTTHLVKHHIDTGNERPIASAPHRASAAENDTINGLTDEMLQQGIIRPRRSPWFSPVVLVPKPDGSVRFCVDYRRLSAKTTKDVYPLTRIDDALHSLGKAKYFSTMDLTSSYWQIELDDESKPKSAFVCRRGLFEFIRMPFGLCYAPATMQRLMDSVLAGLKWQTCLVYLDDVITFSPTFEQHCCIHTTSKVNIHG